MQKRFLCLAAIFAVLAFGLVGFSQKTCCDDAGSPAPPAPDYFDLGGGVVALTMFVAAASGVQIIRLRRKR